MKKTFKAVIFLLLLSSVPAFAAHLITNPDTCDYYVVSGLPAGFTAASNVPGDPTGKAGMSLDISGLPAVTTDTKFTVTAQCCRSQTSTQTGGCSAATSPFSFTQTATPPVPAGLTVAP